MIIPNKRPLRAHVRAKGRIYEGRRSVDVHDLLGGHALEKHVGKSKQRLLDRFKREPDIKGSSSFASRKLANWAQRKFIKHYKREIAEWLKTNKPMFKRKLELDRELGLVVDRKGRMYKGTKVEAVLVRDETEVGYHVLTIYIVK